MTNNLKNELEKIKMSEDTKERIIAACENSVRNKVISKTDNDGYTDHVFTAERIKPKNRLMRSISAIAACAVIAGGVGTAGYIFHRNGSAPAAEVETTEAAACRSCPFGDFSTYDYSLAKGKGVKINAVQLNNEEKDKVSTFLNNFDWGEQITLDDISDEDMQVTDYYTYRLQWKTDNVKHYLGVFDMGYAVYYELSDDDDNDGDAICDPKDQNIYRMDYEAFDKGMREIITSGMPSIFGDFSTFDFTIISGDGRSMSYDLETYDKLAEYFNNFDWGEEYDEENVPEEYLKDTYAELYHITWSSDGCMFTLVVPDNGAVIYKIADYIPDGAEDSIEYNTKYFLIDFEAFNEGLQEILAEDKLSETDDEDLMQVVDEEKQEYLNGFTDVQLVISLRDENNNEIAIPDENKEKFQSMIEGEFKYKSMLKSEPVDTENGTEMGSQVYGIDLRYMSGGKEVLGRYYNIMGDGSVILSDCEYDSAKDSKWSGPFMYYIDINDLYAKLAECGLR